MRGSLAEVIVPEVLEEIVAPGLLKFTLLNRLKDSARNWRLLFSNGARSTD